MSADSMETRVSRRRAEALGSLKTAPRVGDRTQVGSRYNHRVMKSAVVVSDPEIMHGTPCFQGTRVPFKNLIDYLEGGYSLDEFVREFPTVSREQAVQALEAAKDSLLAQIA